MDESKYYRFSKSQIKLERPLTEEESDDLVKVNSYWLALVDENLEADHEVFVIMALSFLNTADVMEAMNLAYEKKRVITANIIDRVFDDFVSICMSCAPTRKVIRPVRLKFEVVK